MEELKNTLTTNRLFFEQLLNNVKNKNIKSIQKAVNFATNTGCGYLSSHVIEEELLKIAKDFQTIQNEKYQKGCILHVMTEAYETGGHTRIVERWIELSPNNEKHSVLLMNQNKKNKISNKLISNIDSKNGKLILLDKISLKEKIIKLREIASNYEYIILHTHMNDIIPTIAFGTDNFKRPIIFFNHADHLFWLGVSIADLVVNFRNYGEDININYRGIEKTRNEILTLPQDITNNAVSKIDKNLLKNRLNIGNHKVILTLGSAFKYKKFNDIDFLIFADKVLQSCNNVVIIAIGIDYNVLPEWIIYKEKFKNRFIIQSVIPYQKLQEYFLIADLYVDSMPIGGGTAIIDALSYNIPILSLNSSIGQNDFVTESEAYCKTMDELILKTKHILLDYDYGEKILNTLKTSFFKHNDIKIFQQQLNNIYSKVSKHSIYKFNETIKLDEHMLLLIAAYQKVKIKKFNLFFCKLVREKTIYGVKYYLRITKDNK